MSIPVQQRVCVCVNGKSKPFHAAWNKAISSLVSYQIAQHSLFPNEKCCSRLNSAAVDRCIHGTDNGTNITLAVTILLTLLLLLLGRSPVAKIKLPEL